MFTNIINVIILGYAIVQLPEFLRACYLAIRKYLSKKKDKKNTTKNQIEIEEIKYDQTTNVDTNQVERLVKINMKNYIYYKLEVLRNLKKETSISGERYDDKDGMKEMITQEVNLLIQVLDNR